MNMPTIDHPTGQANFAFLSVGPIELAFSYETVIAFRAGTGRWIVSENCWGPTTGKHLNLVPGGDDKANRKPRGLFEAELLGCLALLVYGAYRSTDVVGTPSEDLLAMGGVEGVTDQEVEEFLS